MTMSVLASFLMLAAGASVPTKPRAVPPASAPTKPAIRLPKGSEVPVRLAHGVSAKTAQVGDRVILRVAEAVVRQGAIIIPEGAMVEGEVSGMTEPGRFGRAGSLEIEAKAILFEDGSRLLLVGALRRDAPENRARATEGVVTVPFGALSRGKSVNLEAGTIFVAITARDY